MLDRDVPPADLPHRLAGAARELGGEAVRWWWAQMQRLGAIGPSSRPAARFGSFGWRSVVCFPSESIVNPQAIHIGEQTVIAPYVTLSAGWMPDQPGLGERVVSIGDRCLIGRGSTIVGHLSIEIGDDVWTGHQVQVTDMNHGYDDPSEPISRQHAEPRPVSVGDGSWIGAGAIVLPGVRIGRNVVVGAGSVVTHDVPDHSVVVGSPARLVRRYRAGVGWVAVDAGHEAL